jgi:diaminopimelate epimerase
MQKEFNKYQGAGNDFIMIDNRDNSFPMHNNKLIETLCDRHFGIGADGLILLSDHSDCDFEMHYYNADGKPGTMCGNGGRCAYAFALEIGLVNGDSVFYAADGSHSASLSARNEVRISMKDVYKPIIIAGNHFLDTGSPHYVIPVPRVDSIDVVTRGRSIRWTKQFEPAGTNVNFLEVLGDRIKVRTYERGVENETLSCGTGITASAISSRWGKPEEKHRVVVETRGGLLEVGFSLSNEKATDIYLLGPALKVYSGIIDIKN